MTLYPRKVDKLFIFDLTGQDDQDYYRNDIVALSVEANDGDI